jgi:hypothetical protein
VNSEGETEGSGDEEVLAKVIGTLETNNAARLVAINLALLPKT